MRRLRHLARAGFTLIELMVVMIILVLLAALVLPKVMGRAEEARRKTTIVQLRGIMSALDLYRADNSGRVPTSEQGLEALVKEPTSPPKPKRWKGPYLEGDQVPKDGWGSDFNYLALEDNRDYKLWSFGADQVEGGEELDADINSWQRETWAEE